ncbi:CarboxypepD_reg-like domain-containing protein [bacterium A37T11]|nr:CarboxypepD_reg-like domain-containing protein [bacterium A37T11]
MRRIFKYCLLVVCFFSLYSKSLKAQFRLSGKVLDSLTLNGLQGASVKLVSSNDSIVSYGSAGENGRFTITVPRAGKYRISANFLGYKSTSFPVMIKSNERSKTVNVPLPAEIKELDAVEITAPVPMVEVRGDTTEFNAAAYSTEPYADADALVGQIPGVEIDDEGKIKAQGEDVQRIIVDGKEFFSSDPRVALKTLPADVIEKIQIIDEQSEQARFTGFDDGQRHKIINIVTKKDRRHGYFGRLAGAMGSNKRYNGGGNINFFNNSRRLSILEVSNNVNQQNFSMAEIGAEDDGGGRGGGGRGSRRGGGGGNGGRSGGNNGQSKTNNVSINYNNTWLDERMEFSGDYTYNTRNNDVNSINNRQLFVGDGEDQFRVQQNLSNSINNSHRANIKMEFKPDSNQSMVFTPTFSYQQNNRLSTNTSNTVNESQDPLTSANSNNNNQNRNVNIAGNFTYRFHLGKPGRTISLSANGSYSSNKGLAQALSFTHYLENQERIDTVNNQNNSLGNGNGITGRFAYTEPLDSFSRIQANYSIRNTANFSNRQTFNFLAETGQYSELDDRLSNEFRNEYLYHSGGLSYQWSKNIVMFDFGMDYQRAEMQNHKVFPTEVKASESFVSYLPNANLRLRFSREMNLRFEYSTETNPPSIDQLQDVTTSTNTQSVKSGNPDLKQEFQQRFRVSFDKVNRQTGANLNVSLNADFSKNRVVNSVIIVKSDTTINGFELRRDGQFTRPENLNGYYSLRANASYGTPIKALKINMNLSTNVFRTRDVGLMNGSLSASNSYGFSQKVGINSHISEKLIFGLSYNGSFNVVKNNLLTDPSSNSNYFNQTIRNDVTWIFWKGIRINSSVLYNYNSGLTGGLNPSFVTWNASIGKKLFSRQEAEITFSAYDLLNNSTNVSRDITQSYIQDSQTLNMLRQYFTLGFTYNLRNFGGRLMGNGGGFRRGGGRG